MKPPSGRTLTLPCAGPLLTAAVSGSLSASLSFPSRLPLSVPFAPTLNESPPATGSVFQRRSSNVIATPVYCRVSFVMCSPLTVSGFTAAVDDVNAEPTTVEPRKAVSVAVPPELWPVLIVAVLIGLSNVIVSGPEGSLPLV